MPGAGFTAIPCTVLSSLSILGIIGPQLGQITDIAGKVLLAMLVFLVWETTVCGCASQLHGSCLISVEGCLKDQRLNCLLEPCGLECRSAEYGNDRILMGAHYTMDVMGGRTLALYDLAHLLANDPAYLGQSFPGVPVIKDFRAAVRAARADMTTALQTACGDTIADRSPL